MEEFLKEVIIEQLSIKDPKEINTKKGKKIIHGIGIKVKDKWYNATAWDEDELKKYNVLVKGSKHWLVFYQKEGYNNFKFPSRVDILENRVKALEAKFDTLN